MLTKKEIRRQFGAMGLKASLRKHGLIENGLSLFVTDNGVEVVGNFNVFCRSHYEKYKTAIDLSNSFKGQILESGEKVI